MKKLWISLALAVLLAVCAAGCGAQQAPVSLAVPDPELPGTPHATSGSIVVRGFEWGPGVPKVIVELDTAADAVSSDGAWLSCRGERTVENVYLSDELGIETAGPSRYVTLELATSFDSTGSPFEVDMETEHNIWADTYIVQTGFTVMSGGVYFDVTFTGDCIDNRVCPELERFTVRESYTGTYYNPITGQADELTIAYAAYEPDILRSWEQNPLIVWLHGRGEGGEDIEKTILGNEVSALTEGEIQSHFVSGEQIGAYVLVPQCPTYWLDPGDGRESRGDVPSLYTQALMDTIEAYVASNPDVDRSRIYLMGASNGGFMTLNMLIEYPDYFAAGVSCSTAYAYNVYAKDWQGNYRTFFNQYIRTRWVYLTEEKVQALTQTPLWMVAAMTDVIVSTFEYTMPIYEALLSAGADNAWCSLYFEVMGTESSDTRYLGHWSWVYLLNDQVAAVQDRERVLNTADLFWSFSPSAAGVSCSTAYAYNIYAKDWQGNYRTFFNQYIRTQWVYLTEEKVQALTQTPLWMVAAMTDTIVSTYEYTMPIYEALLSAGADNAWCSLYFEVMGTESSDTRYLGHWSWVYLLNDQVAAVQDRNRIQNAQTPFGRFWPTADGGTSYVTGGDGEAYASLFDWLNDQSR